MEILRDVIGELVVPYCPHCAVNKIAVQCIGFWKIDEKFLGGAAVCRQCKRGITFEGYFTESKAGKKFYFQNIYPSPDFAKELPHVPANIAGTFKNAQQSLTLLLGKARSDNEQEKQEVAPTAEVVAVVCRMVLEKTIKTVMPDCDESNSLYKNIQALIESRHLQDILSGWMHTIRCLGNTGAHGDDEVSPQDAVNAVNFTEMLL